MKNILENLNPEQKKAVQTTEGPVLIIAGAGSGKTRVLAHRIAYLIFEKKIWPNRILAVTFTNKAANEMKERVYRLLGYQNIEKFKNLMPFLGTFHSICAKILRVEIKNLGYKSNFAILDEEDQKKAVKRAEENLRIDPKEYAPELILSQISANKSNLMTPKKYQSFVSSNFQEIVLIIWQEYEKILKANQALDFDDLINKTVEIFQKFPKVLAKYQEKFRYILIDEYQDTNRAQYKLVQLLAKKFQNICVVGDPDQSIYGWRGADISNILNFEADFPKAKVIKLEQNYRSTQNILNAAHYVISKNIVRKEKRLWTENEIGVPVVLYEAQNERDEARFVIDEIHELLKRKELKSFLDFVILYRTNAQSRALEEVFLEYGMPYKIVGGVRFYDRKEIKDIVAYLRLIANPEDRLSLERIINVPARGIGPVGLKLIASGEWKQNTKIKLFFKMMEELRQRAKTLNLVDLIDLVLKKTGYEKMLLDGSIEGESRFENVQELKSVASNEMLVLGGQPPKAQLAAFLETVALQTDIDEWDEKADAVTMMTAHNAKGLEFPVVFMVGMEEGLFPHSRSLLEVADLEEERRLCYVGMTRAMKRLYLTYASARMIFGGFQANIKSRFLEDIPDEVAARIETGKIKKDKSDKKEIGMDNGSIKRYKEGDKVIHNQFGEGMVVQVDGDIIKVAFEGIGIKTISASIAPIRKKV